MWLREAHAFGSLITCAEALRDGPDEAFPLIRLSDDRETSVRATMRGKATAEVRSAVQVAVTVDLSKAAAWTLIGEREKSYPLVERHVWRQGA